MKKKRTTYKYKTECGMELESSEDLKECRVIIGCKYENCKEFENHPISEKCKSCKFHKNISNDRVFSRNSDAIYNRTIYGCIAKSIDKKYKSLENKFQLELFDSPASNLRRKFTIEIIIQSDNLRRVFYSNIIGENDYQPMNDLEAILEKIYNKYTKDEKIIFMNNIQTAEITPIDFGTFDEFYDSLVSARIVKFSSQIIR